MIRKLIIIILAVIGVAALVYFGFDWITNGLDSLKDKAVEYGEEIRQLPQKIQEMTDGENP